MDFFDLITTILRTVGFLYVLMVVFSGIYDLCDTHIQRRRARKNPS